jgi:hypothetical protein
MLTSDTAVMSGVRRMVMLVRRAGHTHTAAAAAAACDFALRMLGAEWILVLLVLSAEEEQEQQKEQGESIIE